VYLFLSTVVGGQFTLTFVELGTIPFVLLLFQPGVVLTSKFSLLLLSLASLRLRVVILQLSRAIEACSAVFALERPRIFMPFDMVFQMALGDELLIAVGALMVPLSIVAASMDLQVPVLGEALAADVARKWLHALVLSDVDFQTRLLRITPATNLAGERLLGAMVEHVCLQVSFRYEGHLTIIVRARVGSFSSLEGIIL
jgi:hypothetical protein